MTSLQTQALSRTEANPNISGQFEIQTRLFIFQNFT